MPRGEREIEREKLREEALEVTAVKYLSLDAFGIVRADCFWEGFEEFRDIVAERYPELDFSSIICPTRGC